VNTIGIYPERADSARGRRRTVPITGRGVRMVKVMNRAEGASLIRVDSDCIQGVNASSGECWWRWFILG